MLNNVCICWCVAGQTSSTVWWHTFDDRNVCILGTEVKLFISIQKYKYLTISNETNMGILNP